MSAAGNSSRRATLLERQGHAAVVGTGKEQERLFIASVLLLGWRALRRRFPQERWSRASERMLAFCASPTTSRIRATLPSPMIVAPAKTLSPLQLLAERLHYDFFRVIDFVHDQAKGMIVRLQHDDIRGSSWLHRVLVSVSASFSSSLR